MKQSGEIPECYKDCPIICIPTGPIVDEVDGDCSELDESDSELKLSEYEACLSAS